MFLTPLFSAPVDIMIMLLGAFCIGYGIAWLMRRNTINDLKGSVTVYQKEIRSLNIALENLDIEKDQLQDKLNACVESMTNMVNLEELQRATSELKKERERSETARNSLIEIESAHEALKRELQFKIDQLRAEVSRLRMTNASLEQEIRELKQNSLQDPGQVPTFISNIGLRPASSDQKDDLKKISGVGPFIEQQLHRLGIFTYDQIASMTHEQAEKINEAIEFFPGRIQRDDWVGQARSLKRD